MLLLIDVSQLFIYRRFVLLLFIHSVVEYIIIIIVIINVNCDNFVFILCV